MADRSKVLVLPGLLGSNLDRDDGQRAKKRWWYSPPQVLQGAVKYLQLEDDGTTPTNPVAAPITTRSLVGDALAPLVAQLVKSWDVAIAPYDWRYSIQRIAQDVLRLSTEVFGQNPFSIVGYSFGGLVAREMWRQLNSLNNTARLLRIVTIGTPHWGSYAATGLFGKVDKEYYQLAVASAPANYTFTDAIQAVRTLNPFGFLDKVIASWPSIYHLSPNLSQPNVTNDPLRSKIYTAGNYAAFNNFVKQKWCDDAVQVQALLAGSAAIPPWDRIVCIRGLGVSTDAFVRAPLRLNSGAGYGEEDGDGRVTAKSALLASSSFDVYGNHDFLPSHPIVLAHIDNLLLHGLPTSTTIVDNPGGVVSPGPDGPGENVSIKGEILSPPTPPTFNVVKLPAPVIPVNGPGEPAPIWCPVGPRLP